MYYVGCHWGTLDDGYICSSSRMRRAYKRRPKDFKRRILKSNISRESLLSEEHNWLQLINDEELGIRYYNLSKKQFGHWSVDNEDRLTVREKISDAIKKLHKDPEYKKKYSEGRKKMPPQTPEQISKRAKSNTGKKRTDETKQKMRESWSDERRNKASDLISGKNNYFYGKRLTGDKNGFYGKQHDPELKKKMNAKTSATMKGRPPNNAEWMRGTFWWNNGKINKRSKDCPGKDWTRGKVKG